MSAPINNQFTGGYQINEKEGKLNEFGSSIETDTNPMTNRKGEELKADGGGMFKKFEGPSTGDTNMKNLEEEEGNDQNPEDVLTALENDDIDIVTNTSAESKEKNETISTNLESHSEHPAYPMFDNFNATEREFNQPEITEEIFLQITEGLSEEGGLDIKEINNKIKEASIEDKDLQRNLLNYIRKTMALNPQKSLETDGETTELPEEFKQNSLLNNPESDINQLLISNYIRFPQGIEGNPNFEQDIHICCKTTANSIIKGKDIPRNEGFQIAMNEIQSTHLGTQLNGLKYLYKVANTNEGQHGKKQQEKGKKLNDVRIANNDASEAFNKGQKETVATGIEQKAKAAERAKLYAENNKALENSSLNEGGDIYGETGEIEAINNSISA